MNQSLISLFSCAIGGSGDGEPSPAYTPDSAFDALRAGNGRFVDGKNSHPRADGARREETAKGQHPFATILSCSDSRVPPEHLFDQGIGDLFVIRVAGNVCDVDETGTIEYGVDHLETPLLVVMGHTKCGAVTAVAKKAELHGSIPKLVDNIEPAVEKARAQNPRLEGDELILSCIRSNVYQAIEDLLKSSPAIRKRVQEKKVKIVGAVYDIENGVVGWMGPHPMEAELLASGKEVAHGDHGAHADSPAHSEHATNEHHEEPDSKVKEHEAQYPTAYREGLTTSAFVIGCGALLTLGLLAGWSFGRMRPSGKSQVQAPADEGKTPSGKA